MKSTGIVRKVDLLGRVVVPVELRNTLSMAIDDPVAFYVDGNTIIIRKHETSCVLCGGTDNLKTFKDKYVCEKCAKELQEEDQ